MTLITTPKTDDAITLPTDSTWKTVRSVSVPGSAGETIWTGVYMNVSGLLKSGKPVGIIDVQALRDGGTDVTALATYAAVQDTKDSATGLYTFRIYISHEWFMAKNFSSITWQIKCRRHIQKASIKAGFYAKASND